MPDRMGLILLVENLDQYEAAVKSVKSANDQVASSLGVVEVRGKKTSKSMVKMAGSFAVGAVAARAFFKAMDVIVGGLKRLIVGSTMVAARNEVLAGVLEEVGTRAGYSTEQLAEYEEKLRETGITIQATRQTMLQMIQSKIDLAIATDLARVAQNAAVIADMDSSASYIRVIDAIQRGEPELLKLLGLRVNFVAAEESAAKALDTTRKALTSQQAIQARANEVMRAGADIAGAYEKAMGLAGKQMRSIPRYVQDIQDALGQLGLPTFTIGVTEVKNALADVAVWLAENEEQLEELGEAFAMLAEATITLADLELPVEELVKFTDTLTTLVSMLALGVETVEKWNVKLDLMGDLLAKLSPMMPAMEIGRGVSAIIDKFTELRKADEDLFKTQQRLQQEREAAMDAVLQKELDAEGARRKAYREALQGMRDGAAAQREATEEEIALAEKLADLRLDLQRELVDDLIDEERRLLKEAVSLAREREDQARRIAKAIADAHASAAADRADLVADAAEDRTDYERGALRDWERLEKSAAGRRGKIDQAHADRRIDIEVATRRKLEDIQRQFEMSLLDAGRTRDAFALVQAQRRAAADRGAALRGRDEQLSDAEKATGRQQADFAKNLARQRDDLRASLAEQAADMEASLRERQQAIEIQLREQLASIEAERREEEVERARAMTREREDTARQAAWEQEDRTRRLQRQLQDMEVQYGDLGDVTAEGLQQQVREWAGAYGPGGAVTQIVEDWADIVEDELDGVMAALDKTTAAADALKRGFDILAQSSYKIDFELPPEFELQSPKLGLHLGLEKLQEQLRQPMSFMTGGAPTAASTFSRTETFAKMQSAHSIDVNMPDMDTVIASQMVGMFRQVLMAAQ